jgi:two-component system, NarL family, response regulator DegU
MRIMLANDYINVHRGLAGPLREEDDVEPVREASDRDAAVNPVREIRPDFMLMDIRIPGLNGIETTQIIHREFRRYVLLLPWFPCGREDTWRR